MELVAGIVVAVAALALVLEPLVRGDVDQGAPTSPVDELDFTDIQESESPKIQALLALKEIEFDRATGKLSDEYYGALKKRYANVALAAIKAEDAVGEYAWDDPAEAAIGERGHLLVRRVHLVGHVLRQIRRSARVVASHLSLPVESTIVGRAAKRFPPEGSSVRTVVRR